MDTGVIVAIISAASAVVVAVITALLGLRSYRRQKAVDREEELRKERAKAYSAYLSAYAETERWKGVDGKEKEYETSNTEMVGYRLGRDNSVRFEPTVKRVAPRRRCAAGAARDRRRFQGSSLQSRGVIGRNRYCFGCCSATA